MAIKKEMKLGGQIRFESAQPMQLSGSSSELSTDEVPPEQVEILNAVGDTIFEYRAAAKKLLEGRLSHLSGFAPPHLATPGNTVVAVCSEGVVVRYETLVDTESQFVALWMKGSLRDVASTLSQKLIWIRDAHKKEEPPNDFGSTITLSAGEPGAENRREFAQARISFSASTAPSHSPTDAHGRPFRLLSLRNSLTLELHGELAPNEPPKRQGFVLRSNIRLPVGWDCIEVFPTADASVWRKDLASMSAEIDILAAVIAHQMLDAKLHALDPNAEARRQYAILIGQFSKLMESNPKEEELQQFLTLNPSLLCPAYAGVWPKLALGKNVTDFVFREATGDYLLVELEKSTDPLFVKNGHASRQLNHARGQIQDWARYIADNLHTVRHEVGLVDIAANPKRLVVMGRARDLTPANRQKLAAIEGEAPSLKILTYDDVLQNAKTVIENFLGRLWETPGHTRVFYVTKP